MSIVLRKFQGRLTPMMKSLGGSFGDAAGPGAVLSFLFSPLMVMILAIAFAITWFLAHSGGVSAAHGVFSLATITLTGPLDKQVRDADEMLSAKSKSLHDIFEKAGDDVDFAKPDVLTLTGKKSSQEVVEHVRALNGELEDIGRKRDEVMNLKKIKDDNTKRRTDPANPLNHGGDEDRRNDRKSVVLKSIGEIVMKSAAMAEYLKSKAPHISLEEGFGIDGLKAAFLTSAGWAPESLRVPGLVIEKATRPIQLLDIIPTGPTGMAAVKYMEETTRTEASAERSENASYAESAYALTERSETVRSIGASVPVSDEQLEDVEGAQTYLESRLVFGNRQRLDGQILVGDGNAPNLTGIKNKAGIQTQAKGADPIPDAVFKAMTLVRVTGRAFPSAVVMHPTDWQKVKLLRTADGIYIWGSPSEATPDRIWGLQLVQCDADAAGTAYVGDYVNFCQLYERRGMEVAVGYVNNDFLQGRRTIRAGLRVAFAIYRAAAFCTVTGL